MEIVVFFGVPKTTFFHADFGKEIPSRTLWRGRSWNCPSPKLCAVPFALQNRALFEGEQRVKRSREKGGKRGGQQRGRKGKKDAWKQVRKTVLLVNRAFVPPEKKGFLTKMAKMTNLHSDQWNKGFAAWTPWNDENDENGGCPTGKGMVYQKHRFLDPEFWYCGRILLSVPIRCLFSGKDSIQITIAVVNCRHTRNDYLSNWKTLQDGNGNGNFEEINSYDFLDGNWESMEMKGRLQGPRR